MTARQCSSGFSLIELVVALLLLGMIALAAQSGLHFGIQVWRRSDVTISTIDRMWTAQSVLREVLSSIEPRFKGEYPTFSGQSNVLSFDADPPNAFARYGIAHVTLSVRGQGSHEFLEISMAGLRSSSPKKQAILATDLSDMRFEYLDTTDRSATWLSSWQDRTNWPVAVRVISADPKRWPSMVIRLAITDTPSCLFDPEKMTCRRL